MKRSERFERRAAGQLWMAVFYSVLWVAALAWSVRLCQEIGGMSWLVALLADALALGFVAGQWREARATARWAELERWYEARLLDDEVKKCRVSSGGNDQ